MTNEKQIVKDYIEIYKSLKQSDDVFESIFISTVMAEQCINQLAHKYGISKKRLNEIIFENRMYINMHLF